MAVDCDDGSRAPARPHDDPATAEGQPEVHGGRSISREAFLGPQTVSPLTSRIAIRVSGRWSGPSGKGHQARVKQEVASSFRSVLADRWPLARRLLFAGARSEDGDVTGRDFALHPGRVRENRHQLRQLDWIVS